MIGKGSGKNKTSFNIEDCHLPQHVLRVTVGLYSCYSGLCCTFSLSFEVKCHDRSER